MRVYRHEDLGKQNPILQRWELHCSCPTTRVVFALKDFANSYVTL